MFIKVVALGALASASAFVLTSTPTRCARSFIHMKMRNGVTMKMQLTSVIRPHDNLSDHPASGSGRCTSDIMTIQPLPPLPSFLEDIEKDIPELFKKFDNGSGMLNVNQLEQVLGRPTDMKQTWEGRNSAIDPRQSSTDTEMLFKRADHDGNGLLDYEEFERLMNWHAWQHLCSHSFQPAT